MNVQAQLPGIYDHTADIFAAVFLFILELNLETQIGTPVPNKTMDTPLTSANVSINQKMVSVFLAMISFRRCLMT